MNSLSDIAKATKAVDASCTHEVGEYLLRYREGHQADIAVAYLHSQGFHVVGEPTLSDKTNLWLVNFRLPKNYYGIGKSMGSQYSQDAARGLGQAHYSPETYVKVKVWTSGEVKAVYARTQSATFPVTLPFIATDTDLGYAVYYRGEGYQ